MLTSSLRQMLRQTEESEDGCLFWTGKQDREARPVVREGAGWTLVRDRLWAALHKEAQGEAVIAATCGNQLCVLGEHLFLEDETLVSGDPSGDNEETVVAVGAEESGDNEVPRLPSAADLNRLKEKCPRGHVYDGENTFYEQRPGGGTSRRCRACGRLRKRELRGSTKGKWAGE